MRRAGYLGKMGVVLAAGCAVGACLVAAVMVGRSVRKRRGRKRVAKVLEELEVDCATPLGRLRQVVDAMAVEMHAGLASDGGSKLKMLITYVHNLPTGREKGTYYGLDLGGTNIRVIRIQLSGDRSSVGHTVHEQTIPEHLLTSTNEELFDFVAALLKDFAETEEEDAEILQQRETMELGFTFSFPVRQISSLSGTLIKWTKGFSIQDMIGKDVSQCLEQAMSRRGLDMRVAALINDTVGTLALSHYLDDETVAAVVFGTGTNACYLERADAIIKSQGLFTTSGSMVVNMEWGNFWSSHFRRTPYDIEMDADSPNPNEQGFEKMISGMYLGDIVRRVILRMLQEPEPLAPLCSSKLHNPFILTTPMIAAMHEDESQDLIEVTRILQETLEIPDAPLYIRKLVVKACDLVTCRAARLAAAGIVGILKKIGRDGSSSCKEAEMRRSVVAVDGSLYTNYRSFREYLNEAMEELLGEDAASRVAIRATKDGSGIGAALLAASSSSAASC